jgi:hypothetical protein
MRVATSGVQVLECHLGDEYVIVHACYRLEHPFIAYFQMHSIAFHHNQHCESHNKHLASRA